jgi:hypothetical protein
MIQSIAAARARCKGIATDASQQMTGSTVVPRVRGLTAIGGRRSSLPWPSGGREVRRAGGFDATFEPAAALASGLGGAPGKGVKESNGITLEAGLC